jgi:tetratricopeptide (TPR) repeat protein
MTRLYYISIYINKVHAMFLIRVLFLFFFSISIAVADGGGGSGGDVINLGKYNSELKPIIKLINNQDYKNALMKLETFVYENPQSADGWNYIGFVSRNLEKYEDAERYYGLGLEIDSKHKGILEYQGELYLKTNRIDKAIANLAVLDDLCSFNCTYKNKLAKKIDEAVSSAF